MEKYNQIFKKYRIEEEEILEFLEFLKTKECCPFAKYKMDHYNFLEKLYAMERELRKENWKFLPEGLTKEHYLIKEFFQEYPLLIFEEYSKIYANHRVMNFTEKFSSNKRKTFKGGYGALKKILKNNNRI